MTDAKTRGENATATTTADRAPAQAQATKTNQTAPQCPKRDLDKFKIMAMRRERARALEKKRRVREREERYLVDIVIPRIEAFKYNLELERLKSIGLEKLREQREQQTKERKKRRQYHQLSRDQVEECAWAMFDEHVATHGGLERRADEGGEAWGRRVQALNDRVCDLWDANLRRIALSWPRYVEGLPAHELLYGPVLFPRAPPPQTSAARGCLQCQLKGLACSRLVKVPTATFAPPAKPLGKKKKAVADGLMKAWRFLNEQRVKGRI
ncbi:hypothetical protein HIM_07792 [Hirsutella minnesotensis 3608]|uniref:Uncharacterized protein n=1 Tax=Hirsutella minnesotensis 3608 TaxID=1043627 RepID=A0A0F7ZTC0_9HYPO|nr:hypothetical protein HIM_07792 [Hirsutella minnesotensis 3608]